MAIVSVTEMFDERGGKAALGGAGSEGPVRTYSRTHQVITDDPLDGPQTVMFARGIPRLGEIYKSGNDIDHGALCVNVDPQAQSGSRIEWKVRSDYSNKDIGDLKRELGSGSGGQADSGKPGTGANKDKKDSKDQYDPTAQEPKFTVGYRPVVRPLVRDVKGKLVVNSAGDPFDPPPEYEDLMPVLRMTRQVPAGKFDLTAKINGRVVNSDVVKTTDFGQFAPGTLMQVGIELSVETVGGRRVINVTREFWVGESGFKNFLDVGFNYIDPASGNKRLILMLDQDGVPHPVTSPHALRNGNKAAVPDVLAFQVYGEAPFAKM